MKIVLFSLFSGRVDESTTNKWSMDPIQVPIGPVTRARAKRFLMG